MPGYYLNLKTSNKSLDTITKVMFIYNIFPRLYNNIALAYWEEL